MSYGQKQEALLNLHKSYLNRRLNLKWYTKLILLDGKLRLILSFIFLGPLYLILGIIYLYLINYRIKDLLIFQSNPDVAGLIQFTVLMLAFAGSLMTVIELFPPILLTIRRFKPKTTVYEKEKYTKF